MSYIALPYPLGEFNLANLQDKFAKLQEGYFGSSPLGIPFFMPITVNGYILPSAVISVSVKKKIIKTAINGWKGTVKEKWFTEDYALSISGIAHNYENEYPEYDIEQINNLFNIDEPLEIECLLTEILGINTIVLESLNFSDIKGKQNTQIYSITAVSDSDFIADINDDLIIEA